MSFPLEICILFITACIISPLILLGVTTVLRKWNFLDRPHLYKSEIGRAPVPYGAGISILFTILVFVPILYGIIDFTPILEHRLYIIIILGVFIACISFFDDMETIGQSSLRIHPIFRLLMQIGVGIVIGLTSIKISYISNIFGGVIDLTDYHFTFIWSANQITIYYIPLLMTIFWYVLVFNSVNFSDGVPGLTGGFALISFFIMGGLALKLYVSDTSPNAVENSKFLLTLLAIIIPATFFLMRADISRRVIMGDSGTIMLAFLLATFAIVAGGKIATTVSVLGIYLIDLVYVVTRRIMKGRNPLKGDQSSHLHYRLMELGLSQSQIRTIVFSLTAVFGLSAIFLSTIGKIILLVVIAIITIFLTEILSIVRKK